VSHLAMPLDMRDPKSGMAYFTAAIPLAKATKECDQTPHHAAAALAVRPLGGLNEHC
jgi:hypothetical protein